MSWWRGYDGIDVIGGGGVHLCIAAAACSCGACTAACLCAACSCACCSCAACTCAGDICGMPAQPGFQHPGGGNECIDGGAAAYSLSDDDSLLAGLALFFVVPATVAAACALSAALCCLTFRLRCAGICLQLGTVRSYGRLTPSPKESNFLTHETKTKNSGRSSRLPRNSQMATEW